MRSITFPEVTHKIAENQPEYETVHAHVSNTNSDAPSVITICFELTPEEVQEIVSTGKIWYQQVTSTLMAPMSILVNKPQL